MIMPAIPLKPHITFLLLVLGAIGLSQVPVLHWPFSWLETYFHEISHGIAAILSGGSIRNIELNFDGSGVCYTIGGRGALIAFSGYLGAALWGALIYLGARMTGAVSHWMALLMAVLIGISGLLWARDATSWIILIVICSILSVAFYFTLGRIFPVLIEFSGIYVMVSAIRAPTFLLGSTTKNDAAQLAQLTHVPTIVWISAWCVISLAVLFLVWRNQARLR